jgi:hypothetical protein
MLKMEAVCTSETPVDYMALYPRRENSLQKTSFMLDNRNVFMKPLTKDLDKQDNAVDWPRF